MLRGRRADGGHRLRHLLRRARCRHETPGMVHAHGAMDAMAAACLTRYKGSAGLPQPRSR
jgi:hypothetical protein